MVCFPEKLECSSVGSMASAEMFSPLSRQTSFVLGQESESIRIPISSPRLYSAPPGDSVNLLPPSTAPPHVGCLLVGAGDNVGGNSGVSNEVSEIATVEFATSSLYFFSLYKVRWSCLQYPQFCYQFLGVVV